MSEGKKTDRPDSFRVGFFTYQKGSKEYEEEMEKRDKIANARAKERYGPGRSGRATYRLKPRYSYYNAVSLSDEREAEKFVTREKEGFIRAKDGYLGEGLSEVARLLGLRGIAERLVPSALGSIVEDLIETEVRYVQPPFREDLSGLWELNRDFENPEADRRVKDNWLMMPVWNKGTRFVLTRNAASLDMLREIMEEEAVDEAKREEMEQDLIYKAGYMIRSARGRWARNHNVRLDRLPEEFSLALRPVPLHDHQDAIDLVAPEDHNLREVLMHVLKLRGMPAWHFAKLLEQSYHGEGPFERAEEPDV